MSSHQKSKKTNHKSKSHKNKNNQNSDEEIFQNSEDEYVEQSGGDTDDEELGDDDYTFEIVDPDAKDEYDENEDGIYEPVEEFPEYQDADEESEAEGEAEEPEEYEEEILPEEEYAGDTKVCHMKNLDKDFIVLDEDDSHLYGKMEYKKVKNSERESDPIMTYFEMVRIIGTRAQQFNFRAPPLVKGIEHLHPAKMAYLELIAGQVPYLIRRYLPGKKYEDWKTGELDIIHEITDNFLVPENFNKDKFLSQVIKEQL